MERMKEKYVTECIPFMQKEFKYKNKMEVPQLSKIVVNMGVGAAIDDVKLVDNAAIDLQKITGQKPVVTRSKKAIAAFKLKQGVPIGCVVTLRKKRMYEFFDRLVNVALPRLKDFNGVSDKGFDRNGNYTMGLKEQTIFPEIDIEHVQKAVGMNITIVTTAKTDEEARAMLKIMGMPFRKNTAKQ